MTIVSEGQYVQ